MKEVQICFKSNKRHLYTLWNTLNCYPISPIFFEVLSCFHTFATFCSLSNLNIATSASLSTSIRRNIRDSLHQPQCRSSSIPPHIYIPILCQSYLPYIHIEGYFLNPTTPLHLLLIPPFLPDPHSPLPTPPHPTPPQLIPAPLCRSGSIH